METYIRPENIELHYTQPDVSRKIKTKTKRDERREIDMNKKYKKYLKKFKKIMYVEDGSVNTDKLEDWADAQGIQIIVYRQGAIKPEIKEVRDE